MIRQTVARLHWTTAVTLVTLFGCIVVDRFWVSPTEHAVDIVRQQVRQQERQGNKASGGPRVAAIDAFYGHFSGQTELTDQLVKLYAAARNCGVELSSADYELKHLPDLIMVQYAITLPLRGNYVQLRKFLAQVQNDLPGLVLEQISFKRPKLQDSLVEGTARLSLFVVDGR